MNDIKEQLNEIDEGLDFDEQQRQQHERDHTELLKEYTKYQLQTLNSKNDYRSIFFFICLGLLIFPIVFVCVVYRAIFYGWLPDNTYSTIAVIAGGISSFVVNTIVLPRTIAEYFFNKEEDKNIIQMFSNAQKNDQCRNQNGHDRQEILNKIKG